MVRAVCTEAMRDFRLHVVIELTQTQQIYTNGWERETHKKEHFAFNASPKIEFRHIWISFRQFSKKFAIGEIGKAQLKPCL